MTLLIEKVKAIIKLKIWSKVSALLRFNKETSLHNLYPVDTFVKITQSQQFFLSNRFMIKQDIYYLFVRKTVFKIDFFDIKKVGFIFWQNLNLLWPTQQRKNLFKENFCLLLCWHSTDQNQYCKTFRIGKKVAQNDSFSPYFSEEE